MLYMVHVSLCTLWLNDPSIWYLLEDLVSVSGSTTTVHPLNTGGMNYKVPPGASKKRKGMK